MKEPTIATAPPAVPDRRVAVIGQGYVGLPLAHTAVAAGHTVVGFDTDLDKIAMLRAGASPIQDVTDAQLAGMHETGRYHATGDPQRLAECRTYVVTVPTPLRDGRPDLSAVLAAAATIGPHLRDDDLVVLESTVAPGTTRGVFREALAARSAVRPRLAFSPERIDPGNPTWRFANTPKLVGGVEAADTAAAAGFYRTVCDTVVECAGAEVAEMAKLLENTYRYVNIALINELGRHAHGLGISIWEVITAAATKPYGFQPFWPGPGVGGHCLPVDPMYLSDSVERRLGNSFDLVDLADRVNTGQPGYVVDRAAQLLNDQRKCVNGSTVLVLGVAYKRGAGDLRETPAVGIIDRLRRRGAAVLVADPYLDGDMPGMPDVKTVPATPADLTRAARDADLVLLVTDHDQFRYDEISGAARLILDTRNRFARAPHITHL